MKKVTIALIGAGQRGMDCYGAYALKFPYEARFVAVAEPNQARRERFKQVHQLSSDITLLNIGLILLDVACTVYTIVLCERTTRTHRKGKRLGEVHAEFIEKGAQAMATKMAETIFEKTAEKSTEPATEKTSGQVIYEVSEQNA